MRLSKVSLLFVVSLLGICFAQKDEKYVQPTENNVGVFQNEVRQLYEKPMFTVGTDDRLLILETTKNNYRVRSSSGKPGWIEKRLAVVTGKSKTFIMSEAQVEGYLDNPTPVYIMDSDDPNAESITLQRSFSDALRDNVDKETIDRQATH